MNRTQQLSRALANASTSQSKEIKVPTESSRNLLGSRQIICISPRIEDHVVYEGLLVREILIERSDAHPRQLRNLIG